jgi:hypothetical protein
MGKDRRRRLKGAKACKAKLVQDAAFAGSVVASVKSGSKNKSGDSGSKVPAMKKSRAGMRLFISCSLLSKLGTRRENYSMPMTVHVPRLAIELRILVPMFLSLFIVILSTFYFFYCNYWE